MPPDLVPDPMPEVHSPIPASFRDRSGFIFLRDGVLYRQVSRAYSAQYDQFIHSGLYKSLADTGAIVAHEEVEQASSAVDTDVYKILLPDRVPFISYPYEWCFSQLKDAALATLAIQDEALKHGMTLKDASAYNMQFIDGRPVLIDTLSFEPYVEGKPWSAYRQFCQHFLAPLALMSYCDVRLAGLSRLFIDGVSLDLASRLLPLRSKARFPLLIHLHLHAKLQQRYSDAGHGGESVTSKGPQGILQRDVSLRALQGILDSLRSAVSRLSWRPAGTEWGEYYTNTNYSADAMTQKERLVESFLAEIGPGTVWDLGANTGRFSRLASRAGVLTVAFDVDPAAVELNYRECKASRERNLLPLVLDLTNPSPSLGWAHAERDSLGQRGPAHTVLALALVHHLAIANNVPLVRVASYFASLCKVLIIEFVPKEDSQVRRLLATREDVFGDYDAAGFEAAFGREFLIRKAVPIEGSNRTLYLMTNRSEDR